MRSESSATLAYEVLLLVTLGLTSCGAYFWITDPSIKVVTFWESLSRHPLFAISLLLLMALIFVFGIHKRVVAHKIIASRCREVLTDFCLSCDEHGKLIVRPTYSSSSLYTTNYSQLAPPNTSSLQPTTTTTIATTSTHSDLKIQ